MSNNPINEKNKIMQDVKNESRAYLLNETSKSYGAVVLLGSNVAEKASPILAISGIGIPLAAGLFLLGRIIDYGIQNSILFKMVEDCKIILQNALYSHMLIMKKIELYFKYSDEKMQKKLSKFTINKLIVNKIVSKLTLFNTLLETIIPKENEGRFSRLTKRIHRFTHGKYYINEITRELGLLNSFFITYHNQAQELDKYHNKVLKKKSKKIQKKIEKTDEYINYLGNKNFEESIKDIKDKFNSNETANAILKKYQDDISKAGNKLKNETPITEGGSKTRKNIRKNTHKNRTRKSKK